VVDIVVVDVEERETRTYLMDEGAKLTIIKDEAEAAQEAPQRDTLPARASIGHSR
jgi:hypothetical protein